MGLDTLGVTGSNPVAPTRNEVTGRTQLTLTFRRSGVRPSSPGEPGTFPDVSLDEGVAPDGRQRPPHPVLPQAQFRSGPRHARRQGPPARSLRRQGEQGTLPPPRARVV